MRPPSPLALCRIADADALAIDVVDQLVDAARSYWADCTISAAAITVASHYVRDCVAHARGAGPPPPAPSRALADALERIDDPRWRTVCAARQARAQLAAGHHVDTVALAALCSITPAHLRRLVPSRHQRGQVPYATAIALLRARGIVGWC